MAIRLIQASIVMASVLLLASCGPSAETTAAKGPAQVDGARIINADSEPAMWMTVGRTYSEQRFSPLKQINDTNAAQLGLAWSFDLDTARGQEATPLVIDGVMYFSTAWSMVKALDAKTGALKWAFDPKVPREYGVKVCCDVVNRGVAAVERQDLCRHARRPADRARRGERQAGVERADHRSTTEALHDHRRAARRQGQGVHRQWRRRVRRARLHLGL